jgi:hypothetical protein
MVNLFFSYSHKDEQLRNELETHLALLKRQGVISSWHDRRIVAGSDLDQSISDKLEESQIILLLVSAHFLDSDYCYEREMARALDKHEEGAAIVIPVILHPCDWKSAPFGKLKAAPTDAKPVSMYTNQHEAFSIVAKDVREAAVSIESRIPAEPIAKRSPDVGVPADRERSSNLRVKRKFGDRERDEYLESSYEYIARYFENSLGELAHRNSHITTKFKRTSATGFVASIYENDKAVARCSVWYGSHMFGGSAIAYSYGDEGARNSFNESLHVVDDGYSLQLSSLGMQSFAATHNEALSQEGAAESYWTIFIRPLQDQ